MATCPNCGAKSREDPEAFTVTDAWRGLKLGTWSLAGAQFKYAAIVVLRLTCRCGWSIDGRAEGGHFLGDPATQRFPSEG